MAEDHPLCDENSISLEALKSCDLITLHPLFIPFHTGNALQEFITLHAKDHSDIICEDASVNLLMARCGYGAAILPEIYIPEHLNQLRALPLELSEEIDYGVSYYSKGKYIQYFLQNCETCS